MWAVILTEEWGTFVRWAARFCKREVL